MGSMRYRFGSTYYKGKFYPSDIFYKDDISLLDVHS